MNARQKEYFEQQKNMLWEAIQWAVRESDEIHNPYEVEIPKDAFLTRFGVLHHAGTARDRYFRDFMKFGVFKEVLHENSCAPKEDVFQLDKIGLESVAHTYGLHAPQPLRPQPQAQPQ